MTAGAENERLSKCAKMVHREKEGKKKGKIKEGKNKEKTHLIKANGCVYKGKDREKAIKLHICLELLLISTQWGFLMVFGLGTPLFRFGYTTPKNTPPHFEK